MCDDLGVKRFDGDELAGEGVGGAVNGAHAAAAEQVVLEVVDAEATAETATTRFSRSSVGHVPELTLTHFRGTLFHVEVSMETQNITLSLPKEVLLKVKLIAVRQQTSVSGLLAQTLERLVEQEDAYAHARRRHLEWLSREVDLGTGGQRTVGREELHERA